MTKRRVEITLHTLAHFSLYWLITKFVVGDILGNYAVKFSLEDYLN